MSRRGPAQRPSLSHPAPRRTPRIVPDHVMAEPTEPRAPRNDSDRRGGDRRNVERRAPLPPWRRPWAYVGYGVLSGLVLVGAYRLTRPAEPKPQGDAVLVTPPEAPTTNVAPPATQPRPSGQPPQAAYSTADFERLMLEGPRAVGRTVRAELYCAQPATYQVRSNVQAEAVVAALASQGRVPAAECKWGGRDDARRQDFLLLVPPELAATFAAAPLTSDEYQRRRHVVANLEWIGRSEALSLRTAGVFRGVAR